MRLYKFKESTLGPKFASQKVADFKKLIQSHPSFCVLSIPGVGVTNFLRFFASTQKPFHFIFIDAFALTSPTKQNFFQHFLRELGVEPLNNTLPEILNTCKLELDRLCSLESKVVVVLNRFNQLSPLFDFQFFANLRWLQISNRDKVTFICTSNRPLHEISPTAVGGSNLNLFSTSYYFTPYDPSDLQQLHPGSSSENINLSGGHVQLLQLLNKSESGQAIFQDPFIKLQLKAILDVLKPTDRRALEKIAQGKAVSNLNPLLLHLGLVKKTSPVPQLFTPLLEQYLKSSQSTKLPYRESRLLELLKKHLNQVVAKEDIFHYVWTDAWEEASDWALNSLIYRLRKNPAITDTYSLESHKKIGYSLKDK